MVQYSNRWPGLPAYSYLAVPARCCLGACGVAACAPHSTGSPYLWVAARGQAWLALRAAEHVQRAAFRDLCRERRFSARAWLAVRSERAGRLACAEAAYLRATRRSEACRIVRAGRRGPPSPPPGSPWTWPLARRALGAVCVRVRARC